MTSMTEIRSNILTTLSRVLGTICVDLSLNGVKSRSAVGFALTESVRSYCILETNGAAADIRRNRSEHSTVTHVRNSFRSVSTVEAVQRAEAKQIC